MEPPDLGAERDWVRTQVARYRETLPRYQAYADLLGQLLRRTARELAPLAIVQTRPKSVASFADKILRKRAKYRNPVEQLTDLCGARVITRTRSELEAFARFLEGHFGIDWENSLDASGRLRPSEFGYRSVHYIVSFRPDVDYGTAVPQELHGLKAEVQLRTLTEHAWADFAHDLGYKGAFRLPESWVRELAGVAAMLEEADQAFDRIERRLERYVTSYGSYLEPDRMREELARLEMVLEHVPGDVRLSGRAGKLAMALEDWEKAIEIFSRHVDPDKAESAPPFLLRDLGISLCKRHSREMAGAPYRTGLRYLELAADPRHRDVDAVASLAGRFKAAGRHAEAREHYRRAVEMDPADPFALWNHLVYELPERPELLTLLRPVMRQAMKRSRAHAEVGLNLPWAFYDLGNFHLLLGEPYASLDAYAKAIQTSTAAFMVGTSLRTLEPLARLAARLEGFEWARRLLALGWAARFPANPEAAEELRKLASAESAPIAPPVLFVAGGTDPRVEEQMQSYRDLLLAGMADFAGTLISGGTTQGVSGLVGELAERRAGHIRAIGYLPRELPSDATRDARYSELRSSEGLAFSPLEPLQSWVDVLASGIAPAGVRVIGINGGRIAAAEYRIALAVGAPVGIVAESGREAGRMAADAWWTHRGGLEILPRDPDALRAFLKA